MYGSQHLPAVFHHNQSAEVLVGKLQDLTGVDIHLDSQPVQLGILQGAVQPDNLLHPADTQPDLMEDILGLSLIHI